MSQNERGHVHEVLGPARPELEAEQALEVHHAQGGGLRQRHLQGSRPLDRDELGHHVDADPGDGGLHTRKVPFEDVATLHDRGDATPLEPLHHFRKRDPRHEVDVLRGPDVSVGAHREAADEDAVGLPEGLHHPARHAFEARPPQAEAGRNRPRRRWTNALSSEHFRIRAPMRRVSGPRGGAAGAGRRPDTARLCPAATATPLGVSS
jgi:hypothetical protein